MTAILPGRISPVGLSCRTNFFPSTITVWPALAPPLKARHNIEVLRQQVYHFPFAFVSPLSPNHHNIS